MSRERILILDDDPAILKSTAICLKTDFDVSEASSVPQAKTAVSNQPIRLAIVDLNLEGQSESGLDFIVWLSREYPTIPIIVFSGDTDTRRVATTAQRKDVSAFLFKGQLTPQSIRSEVARVLSQKAIVTKMQSEGGMVTRSKTLLGELAKIDRMAAQGSSLPVLILGESGTGKELIARYIAKAFKKDIKRENITNLPKDIAESILFGSKKGAFTGSVHDRVGLITSASESVLFLDEIGDCDLAVQSKLLRVIQDKELIPVGDTRSIRVNTQFVFATHRDLSERVKQGLFREDLLFRIRVLEIHVPALRERPEDIEPITQAILSRLSAGQKIQLTDCAYEALREYHWPGNVRELQNLIERLSITSDSRVVDGKAIRAALVKDEKAQEELNTQNEKNKLTQAILSFHGHRGKIAHFFGWHRNTVTRKIQTHGLDGLFYSAGGRPKVGLERSQDAG